MTSNGLPREPRNSRLVWVCPSCRGPLENAGSRSKHCKKEGYIFHREGGIWEFLSPEQLFKYRQFCEEYLVVRRQEGRGSDDATYYRSLPHVDRSSRFHREWKIRARSFDVFVKEILDKYHSGSRVLDLGAGNCWLSHRIARLGHLPVAIDLLTDPIDGLGAHRNYEAGFQVVQAEFDRIPFASGQFDLAVFNASLHYSTDYKVTLGAAASLLRAGGSIVVIDSPIYNDQASGEQMLRERTEYFERHYGVKSSSMPSKGFLTFQQLDRLAGELAFEWRRISPFYGFSWMLRPLKARLAGHREPAHFMVLVGIKGYHANAED